MKVSRYRKKPVVIEAMQVDSNSIEQVLAWMTMAS